MARNAELIRQWKMLLAVERHRFGQTIPQLAEELGVSTRTIRRDLKALEDAGFPITKDEESAGPHRWMIVGAAFTRLTQSFTVAELSALYFGRTLTRCLAGTPFQADLEQAFEKVAAALPPRLRTFLDRLPAVLAAKSDPSVKLRDRRTQDLIARLMKATLDTRPVGMRYYSFASRRAKDYEVEPHRLVYAQGGLYLIAYVPAYRESRTFAVERIEELDVLDGRFEPKDGVDDQPFPNSLGVNQGRPVHVEIEFSPAIAPYVRERRWHDSQTVKAQADGSVILTLEVCDDPALRSWVLGFGASARVLAPERVARSVFREMTRGRAAYVKRSGFGEE